MKKKYVFLSHILIVVLELLGFYLGFQSLGFGMFEYYTQDSNLLVLFSSILTLIFLFQKKEFPSWLQWFKFTATVSITLTLLVVLTILSWTMGGLSHMMFDGVFLFHHTLCPILSIITYLFLEPYDIREEKFFRKSVSFTILYAEILIFLNIFKVVEGPYPFLMVYKQPIYMSILWAILILGGTFGIAHLLRYFHFKIQTRK